MQTRRTFLTLTACAAVGAGTTACAVAPPPVAMGGTSRQAAGSGRIQAVAFDVFTIFDFSSLDEAAERQFPGKGHELVASWRDKFFQYFFLHTLEGRYVECEKVIDESLRFACKANGLAFEPAGIEAMVGAFFHLKICPDSAEALRRMHEAGLRLGFLSNLTEAMLKSSSEQAGIAPLFEQWLSTDRVRAFKPDPRAYAMAETAFGLDRHEVLFAATGGWDYTGSKAFGMETFWVNRLGFMPETLGIEPDGEGRSLTDLSDYAIARSRKA